MGSNATRREALWATGKKKDEAWLIDLCWFKLLIKLKLSFPAIAVPPTYVAKKPHPPLEVFMYHSTLVCIAWWEGPWISVHWYGSYFTKPDRISLWWWFFSSIIQIFWVSLHWLTHWEHFLGKLFLFLLLISTNISSAENKHDSSNAVILTRGLLHVKYNKICCHIIKQKAMIIPPVRKSIFLWPGPY